MGCHEVEVKGSKDRLKGSRAQGLELGEGGGVPSKAHRIGRGGVGCQAGMKPNWGHDPFGTSYWHSCLPPA